MFCSKCGTQLREEDVFCAGCGTKIKKDNDVASQMGLVDDEVNAAMTSGLVKVKKQKSVKTIVEFAIMFFLLAVIIIGVIANGLYIDIKYDKDEIVSIIEHYDEQFSVKIEERFNELTLVVYPDEIENVSVKEIKNGYWESGYYYIPVVVDIDLSYAELSKVPLVLKIDKNTKLKDIIWSGDSEKKTKKHDIFEHRVEDTKLKYKE